MRQISSEKILQRALKYLSLRPRSRQEITNFLQKKTSDRDLINQITTRLEEMNLIDDKKFAQWLIESRSRSKPRGRRLLRSELKSKGISVEPDTIVIDEKSLAQAALSRKLSTWSRLPWIEFRTKAGRFLASRGFSWPVIEEVIKKSYNKGDVN